MSEDSIVPDRVEEEAVREAKKSKPEDDRVHPDVGVVVKNGAIVGRAHRGELSPGERAEYTVLERKLSADVLVDSTVYTTLPASITSVAAGWASTCAGPIAIASSICG